MTPPGVGWQRILDGPPPFRGDGAFPIAAYSEFLPGPFVGVRPYGGPDDPDPLVCDPEDPSGFGVSHFEEHLQLKPGLARIASHLAAELRRLCAGGHAFSKAILDDNDAWPADLAAAAPRFATAPHLLLVPLALSRTLDDKGRVRWTLFGSSEQGPARPFWQGFLDAEGHERSAAEGARFLAGLVRAAGHSVDGEDPSALARAGFAVLPAGPDPDFPRWGDEPFPSWLRPLLLDDGAAAGAGDRLRTLLTFRPFARLPARVRARFLDGSLAILPFPPSLLPFGHRGYRRLARELPLAMQIPLLHLFPGRHAAPDGIRIPQSGWLSEPLARGARAPSPPPAHLVASVQRTSRWDRTHRDEEETAPSVGARLDGVARVLFSTAAEHLDLYGKPMARNAQIWTRDHRLLLDGPRCEGDSGRQRLDEAARAVAFGGHFGYRFQFPPMRAGRCEIYWHRPLCALASPGEDPMILDGNLGFLTAYRVRGVPGGEDTGAPIALWPRFTGGPDRLLAAELFPHEPPGHRRWSTAYNARKLIDAWEARGERPIPPSLAKRLLVAPRDTQLSEWLDALPARAADPARGRRLADSLRARVSDEEDHAAAPDDPITFDRTANRAFEERYFATIAELAEGRFVDKDNADPAGKSSDGHGRDLDALAEHLHACYLDRIARHGMRGRALVGDHLLRWRTDFDYPWSGGWRGNQSGEGRERNVVLVIPGRDRSQAVIMGDHYDTAYMEDRYEKERGGDLTRRSAAGADDNHSATAALLMAAEVLLPLAREGRLERDVWLVHLTGEEFPSDCLGARALAQRLVEGNLALLSVGDGDGDADPGRIDLSGARVTASFVLDMIAHNHERDRYVFQIAHGASRASARLAERAHRANERWNSRAETWSRDGRRPPGPSERVPDGSRVPAAVEHPHMAGEIRPWWHPRSSLYNTDAQIFSEAGIPVVLLMENYDINRQGYHDSHDTLANIDLDYGAALAAIAIESVADAAIRDDP